jgi:hypothetical protein
VAEADQCDVAGDAGPWASIGKDFFGKDFVKVTSMRCL